MADDAKIQDIALDYIRKAVRGGRSRWPCITLGTLPPSLINRLALHAGELVLVSAFYADDNWYTFTTRRIVSQRHGILQSVDPSHGIREDFGNFKGYGRSKAEDMLPEAGLLPLEVATVTSSVSGELVRFEFETGEASMLPIYATRYWVVKHPAIDKLMTSAKHEK